MLLSHVIDEKATDPEAAAFYGVEVDVESFTPPANLKEISLIYKADAGDIDETLMDVIISYGLAGVDVILEIPAEQTDIDPKYLVSVAANAGFSLSLLPPEVSNEAADQAYFNRLRDFAAVYLTQGNFGKFIAPVTNYLEYLFVELLRGEELPFQINDPYIKNRLMQLSDQDFVDAFKSRLREDFYALFGSRAEFEKFARRMMVQIHDFTGDCVKDLIAQQANQNTTDGGQAAG
jgi:hypothetical protein